MNRNYKKYFLLLIIMMIFSTYISCFPEDELLNSLDNETETDFHVSMTSGNLSRQFRVHLPPVSQTSAEPLPVVLAYHGAGDTAHDFQYWTKFDSVADSLGFIMVYPYSYAYYWVEDVLDSPQGIEIDDIIFSTDIINYCIENLNTDVNRVYAAGYSSGGIFAHRLAYELRDRITAYATYGATMSSLTYNNCNEVSSVPAVMLIGTNDEAIPWNGTNPGSGGYYYMSQAQTLERLLHFNSWSPSDSTLTYLNDLRDLIIVRKMEYRNSEDQVLVENFHILGGSHSWYYGEITPQKEMLVFFNRFPL